MKKINEDMIRKLKYLRLTFLATRWDRYVKEAEQMGLSHEQQLMLIIDDLYGLRMENAVRRRIQRAGMPEVLAMETYPFERQPELNRNKIMAMYDSLEFLGERRNIIWMGPPGCGKTGMASSFLVRVIEQGYTGCFVTFGDLINQLHRSVADHTKEQALKPYLKCDCLLIDAIGYAEVEASHAGLLFELLNKRHRKKSTLLTTNLGFKEWGSYLKNEHLAVALLDRLTEQSEVINMKGCDSLRDKKCCDSVESSDEP